MAQNHSHVAAPFAQAASTITTAEELGVVLMKASYRSALANMVTSADGKSLVVPFSVTTAAAVEKRPADTIICTNQCWRILGQNVVCFSRCTTIEEVAPERTPPDDRTLLALVTPGPPLQNAGLFEQGLTNSLVQAGTAMEAGIILVNAVFSIVSQRADLVGEDGSAELTGIVTVSLPNASAANQPDVTVCTENCWSIFDHEVLCYVECHAIYQ